MFSENIKVRSAPLYGGGHVFVIDELLADPDSLIRFAIRTRGAFSRQALGAFPGVELKMMDSFSEKFETLFRLHLRRHFDVRHTLKCDSRLALATLAPEQLRASHCIPHRVDPCKSKNEAFVGFELFLFRDAALGGIGFHEPINSARNTLDLWDDLQNLPDADALRKHRIARDYCISSSDYFRLVRVVPPKFNRLVVFDGAAFHVPHIAHPNRLSREVENGRLTLAGKLRCTRSASSAGNPNGE